MFLSTEVGLEKQAIPTEVFGGIKDGEDEDDEDD